MNKSLNFFFLSFLLSVSIIGAAQQEVNQQTDALPRDPKAREKIEAARIGMITNKLGLTPAQAEKFWPIYREFSDKRMEIRNEFKSQQNVVNREKAKDEEQKRLVALDLTLKQKELDLEKAYSGKLLNVITADQMLNLRGAERDFQRMLINQLQRREMQQRRENFRERNQQLRDKRN